MQVKAKNEGQYNLRRQRAGTIFQMDNGDVYKKDKDGKPLYDAEGKLVLCKWIEPQEPLERLGIILDISKKPKAPIAMPIKGEAKGDDSKK